MAFPDIKTKVFKPAEELKDSIIQYSIMEINAKNYSELKVKTFPTSLACIGICLGGSRMKFLNYDTNVNYDYSSSVIGNYPIESKTYLRPGQINTRLLTIILSHEGINNLLRIPIYDLSNINISLDCLYGKELSFLLEQLEEEKDEIELIHCLNKFFTQKFRLGKVADPKNIFKVINILNGSTTITSVQKLACTMNMHVRTLERLFRKDIGLPPKELLRIRRFILLKDQVLYNPDIHWTDLLLKCGFYDQAHMYHEIQKVTNMNPLDFFRMARSLNS